MTGMILQSPYVNCSRSSRFSGAAPNVAPTAGENGCAGALLGAKEGDDGSQDAIWKAAD